jgi:hypothetical protein
MKYEYDECFGWSCFADEGSVFENWVLDPSFLGEIATVCGMSRVRD